MIKPTISFKTLGCRLNQYEIDALVSKFHHANYKIVDFTDNADVCIVNTCTVTNKSDQKSRNLIHQAAKQKNSLVVVTGCMANHYKEQLEQQEQISFVIPNEQKSSIFSIVDAHLKGEIALVDNSTRNIFDFDVAEKSFHTRCMLKIQDGCDNFCTFCIIPSVRGRAISRPYSEICDNVLKALDLGYKEIVLTGVNIGRYKFGDCNFDLLVEKILNIPGNFRLRISSIEPDGFGERFWDLMGHSKMCPHVHLCLQSGSDKILLQMRRMYSISKYMEIIGKLKSKYPSFNFTTDVIVGFPGETDADFKATCSIIEQVGFSHVHTFKYSVRDNTRAARMTNQIPEKIKNERSKIIRDLVDQNRLNYMKTFIGQTQTMLSETVKGKIAKGYGEHYLPMELTCEKLISNTFYKTRIVQVVPGKIPILKAELL